MEAPIPTPRKARFAAAALVLAIAACGLAQAADRGPAERQKLIDLAYVLGESHALRQACQGEADQYWRDRMQRLIEVETPDAALSTRLAESFNTGYADAQATFPSCDAATRGEAAKMAERGAQLSKSLAGP